MMRSYTELITRDTFLSRYEYLRLGGRVGQETFGRERHLNQTFYTSREWKQARDRAILRDEGCDLGVIGHDIYDRILVHHMNPIRPEDLIHLTEEAEMRLFDLENLICVSNNTHNAIHYGDESMLPKPFVERRPGDHILWERQW